MYTCKSEHRLTLTNLYRWLNVHFFCVQIVKCSNVKPFRQSVQKEKGLIGHKYAYN